METAEKGEGEGIVTDVETISCALQGCPRGIKNHYWAKVQGQDDGWFLQKDGTSWCPEHNPDWVEGWRAERRKKEKAG